MRTSLHFKLGMGIGVVMVLLWWMARSSLGADADLGGPGAETAFSRSLKTNYTATMWKDRLQVWTNLFDPIYFTRTDGTNIGLTVAARATNTFNSTQFTLTGGTNVNWGPTPLGTNVNLYGNTTNFGTVWGLTTNIFDPVFFDVTNGTNVTADPNAIVAASTDPRLSDARAPTSHNVLDSAFHGDVLTGSIVRGDLLVGNATPKISRFAIGSGFLSGNGTDPSWRLLTLGDVEGLYYTNTFDSNFAVTEGTNVHLAASGVILTNPIVRTNLSIENGSGFTSLKTDSSGYLIITNTGRRFGLLTTSPQDTFHLVGDGINAGYRMSGYGADADIDVRMVWQRANGSAVIPLVVSSGDKLFRFASQGYDGDQFLNATEIRGTVDATPGDNDMPTRMSFFVTADGSASPAERMTLKNDGFLGLNTTGPDRRLDALDTSGPQLRLTYANESTYTDFQTDVNGYLILSPSGARVGLGTSSPGELLDIQKSTTSTASQIGVMRLAAISTGDITDGFGPTFYLGMKDAAGSLNYGPAISAIRDGADDSQSLELKAMNAGVRNDGQLWLDASGSVGIKVSNPTATTYDGATPIFQVADTGANAAISFTRYSANALTPRVIVAKSRGTTIGDFTSVTNSDNLGRFVFAGSDGTDIDTAGAYISAVVNGTVAANSIPADLRFFTSAGGPPLERFTIETGGEVGVNTTGPDRRLDVLDTSGPQLRLTYADSSVFTDFQTDVSGNLTIDPSGSKVNFLDQLDVVSASVPQIRLRSVTTDSAQKNGYLGVGHYLNAEEDVAAFVMTSASGANTIRIGGGSGVMNAVTEVRFYTGATATTLDGSQRMTIDSAGNVGINTVGPDRKLDVLDTAAPQLRLTYADASTYTDLQTDVSGNLILIPSNGNVGIGTTPTAPLHVRAASGVNFFAMIKGEVFSSATAFGSVYGFIVTAISTNGSSSAVTYGGKFIGQDISTGTASGNYNIGVQAVGRQSSTRPVANIWGVNGQVIVDASAGTVTDGKGFYSDGSIAASSTMTRMKHYEVTDMAGAGTIGTQYGFYANPLTKGGNNWGFYQTGSGSNYFGGLTGVNTTGPDRRLDILDTADPQLRLTYADASTYTDIGTDVSGDLTLAPTSQFIEFAGKALKIDPVTGTDAAYVQFINDGGSTFFGQDSSTGGALSGVPYAAAMNTPVGFSLVVAGNTILSLNTNEIRYSRVVANPILTKTTNFTLTSLNNFVVADASSGTITQSLPAVSASTSGWEFTIKRKNAGANNVWVQSSDNKLIDGATNFVLTAQHQSLTVVSDTAQWWIK